MDAILEKLKNWLRSRAPAEVGQTIGLEQERQEPVHEDLPDELADQLQQAIRQLPPHPVHLAAVGEALDEAIARWQADEDEPNCLVVLGNPVDDLMGLLQATLTARDRPALQVVQFQKSWDTRPHQYLTIHTQLKKQIDRLLEVPPSALPSDAAAGNPSAADAAAGDCSAKDQTAAEQSQDGASPSAEPEPAPPEQASPTLVVLPRLEWCFLRCIDGLSGLEYLQDVVLNHRAQFWLIGCNRWAWTYLEHVYRISAYLDQPFTLSQLNSLEIRDWLAPITSRVAIALDRDEPPDGVKSLMTRDTPDDLECWTSKAEKHYFDSLTSKSSGVGAVAAHLWLRSLCPIAESREETGDRPPAASPILAPPANSATAVDMAPSPASPPLLWRDKPTLPPLPTLSASDRYLLFSLLMHGGMSLPHLRISLGDDYGKVRAQVQLLQRAGVVQQVQSLFSLNPLFYPGLKADLSNNNFLVGDD